MQLVSFYLAARIPEIFALNNIAQRLKSELRLSLKVRLRCAYHPTTYEEKTKKIQKKSNIPNPRNG